MEFTFTKDDFLEIKDSSRSWVLNRINNPELTSFSSSQIVANNYTFMFAFQLKLLSLTDALSEVDHRRYIDFLLSFKTQEGWVCDPKVSRETLLANLFRFLIPSNHQRFCPRMLGETRQNLQALSHIDADPGFSNIASYRLIEKIRFLLMTFEDNFSFRNPWNDLAQLSHIAFLLKDSLQPSELKAKIDQIVNKIIPLSKDCHRPNRFEVNGLMKIIMMYNSVNAELPYILRSTAGSILRSIDLSCVPNEGCDVTNLLIIYSGLFSHLSDSDKSMVLVNSERYLLPLLLRRRNEDGGFTFFENRCQTHFYGLKVARSANVSDLHGTLMAVWGISLLQRMKENDITHLNEIVSI